MVCKPSKKSGRSGSRGRTVRLGAWMLAASMAAACVPAGAAEVIGDGVTPTYDEAYYATLDYYGNLTEGSVVKSYALNGAAALTDYGTYDEVHNLTDGTAPVTADGKTTFTFDSANVPDRFYFEGVTAQPFADLPWTVSMSYTLNGVPAKAEDLAGKTGVVEIHIDAVPNESATDYAKNNDTLEAMGIFNADDIVSLKAEGAQVQLIGNLRIVLFLVLPGEEQHFTIEVGSNDFSFDGMTYLMVPATLSQLDQIAELGEKKDDLEKNYDKLSGSLDSLLDAMNGMTGSLYATANGLDELNTARGTLSAGKGPVYDQADILQADFDQIAQLLDPMAGQIQAAGQTISDAKTILQTLTDTAVSLKSELSSLQSDLDNLQHDGKDATNLLRDAAGLKGSLKDLQSALNKLQSSVGGGSTDGTKSAKDTLKQIVALGSAYDAALDVENEALQEFVYEMLVASGYPSPQAANMAEACVNGQADAADPSGKLAATYAQLQQLYAGVGQARPSFREFCKMALAAQSPSDDQLDLMEQVWALYNTDNKAALEMVMNNMDGILADLNGAVAGVSSAMASVAAPTAKLVGELAGVCDDFDDLTDLIDDAEGLANTLSNAAGKGEKLLDSVEALQKTLSAYEPKAQETLKTLEDLSVTAASSVRDANTFVATFEALAKKSGSQLDSGTKKTLEGLSAALRQAAKGLATTGDVKTAKNNIDEIITDTWNDHTGDVDRLLLMDSTAEAVSLTSARNAPPESIQVLLRSQEIKLEEPKTEAKESKAADKGTFWSRVADLFRGIWDSITGIFQR